MVRIYKKKRDLAVDMLSKIDFINYIYPEGAFYIFIDISNLKSNLDYKDSFSVEFCDQLLSTNNVAVVPGVAFGMDDYIRISYACSEENLVNGIKGIEEFVNSLL